VFPGWASTEEKCDQVEIRKDIQWKNLISLVLQDRSYLSCVLASFSFVSSFFFGKATLGANLLLLFSASAMENEYKDYKRELGIFLRMICKNFWGGQGECFKMGF